MSFKNFLNAFAAPKLSVKSNTVLTVIPVAALALTALTAPARADFTYTDFSSTAGLQINGNAARVGNVLRLTPATTSQSGSAFTTTQIALGNQNSFSTYFQFQITGSGGISDSDGAGADGLVFVLQNVSNNVGSVGGGIGYYGISPSVGIEFDTYDNGEISGNHVGIDLNGNTNSIAAVNEPTRFNNGEVWNAWVDYNGVSDLLEVRWSSATTRPLNAQLSATVDLVSQLGQSTAYAGFTSGTGGAYGNHDILSWQYRDEFRPVEVNAAAPEPGSIALLLSAGIPVAGLVRRRKTASKLS